MAHKLKKDVSDIAIEGPGLVFIVSSSACHTVCITNFVIQKIHFVFGRSIRKQ